MGFKRKTMFMIVSAARTAAKIRSNNDNELKLKVLTDINNITRYYYYYYYYYLLFVIIIIIIYYFIVVSPPPILYISVPHCN